MVGKKDNKEFEIWLCDDVVVKGETFKAVLQELYNQLIVEFEGDTKAVVEFIRDRVNLYTLAGSCSEAKYDEQTNQLIWEITISPTSIVMDTVKFPISGKFS